MALMTESTNKDDGIREANGGTGKVGKDVLFLGRFATTRAKRSHRQMLLNALVATEQINSACLPKAMPALCHIWRLHRIQANRTSGEQKAIHYQLRSSLHSLDRRSVFVGNAMGMSGPPGASSGECVRLSEEDTRSDMLLLRAYRDLLSQYDNGGRAEWRLPGKMHEHL